MWAGYKNGSFFAYSAISGMARDSLSGGTQEGVSAGYYIGVVQKNMVYRKCFFFVCVSSVSGFVGVWNVRMDVAWP